MREGIVDSDAMSRSGITRLQTLARLLQLPVRRLIAELHAQGVRDSSKCSMRELAAILTVEDVNRVRAKVRALRMRGHGSRYWVAGYPRLLAQWHSTKNGDLFPDEVSYGSARHIWWRCPNGPDHEWRATPSNRIGKRRGCPFCANRAVSVTNSLASFAPHIAAEWHPTKNGMLTPDRIVAKSHRSAWWQCATESKHVWRARLGNRWWNDAGCPFCSGLRVTAENALATRFPKLIREWDGARNKKLSPCRVAWKSHLHVWWRCLRDPTHRWNARIDDRTGPRAAGCPVCAGKAPVPRGAKHGPRNSLVVKLPALLKEWHYERNTNLTPKEVTFGSHAKIWWRCSRDSRHRWRACVGDRSRGTGCPYCAGKRPRKRRLV